MASRATTSRARQGETSAIARAVQTRLSPVVVAAIAGAWLIAVIAQVTGNAAALHHHALIEGGPPLWVAVFVFLIAWQVMVAAMMLPASLPALRAFGARSRRLRRPGLALAIFLAAYATVWTVFGFAAFMSDVALHRVIDASPWLGARSWLIGPSALALAGAYQFGPLKRWGLGACRHPAGAAATVEAAKTGAALLGLRHGIECLASSWVLMFLMFAAGVANLGWMAGLALVMAYETMGRHGQRARSVFGLILFGLAGVALVTGWVPGFGAT